MRPHRPQPKTVTGILGKTTIIAALLLAFPVLGQPNYRLPSMGDPADQAMSPTEEQRIGASYMRYLRANLNLVGDPLLQEYLSSLGERLTTNATYPGFDFTFFIIDEPVINAFAAPGGYIGVNSGLLLASENEAQLAGVMAHEIAHVTQKHLARARDAAKTGSASAAASILAAILLGPSNPQASQAVLAAGLAAGQQLQINYTRENEREADRVGIGILAQTGFDPIGMAEFFETLHRENGGGNNDLLEFLSTHPLSAERVAEAESRALSMRKGQDIKDSLNFQLARMRLRVLTHPALPELAQKLSLQMNEQGETSKRVNAYGLALALYQLRNYSAATTLVKTLTEQQPDNLYYRLLHAQILFALEDIEVGEALFAQLLDLYPDHIPTLHTYALIQEERGEFAQASLLMKKALRHSNRQLPEYYRTLARITDKAGQKSESLEALAEFHALSGNARLAINQLERALELSKPESSKHQRVAARLSELRKSYADQLRESGG